MILCKGDYSNLRVLLICPKYSDFYSHGPQESIIIPPLGLECIAANIMDIANVRIIDNRLYSVSLKVIDKTIKQFQPDYVGISCNYSSQIYIAGRIASIAKSHGSLTVLGGWHPTLAPVETLNLNSVDIVVRAEGENTFRELIQNKSPIGIPGLSYKQDGKQIHNPDRKLMDLNHIRSPVRHFRSVEAKRTYNFFGFPVDCIETSRGCPYTCNFCCIHHFYENSYRSRKIQHIIKELKSNEIKNRACIIFIVDDNFFVDRKFVMALCDAIINKGIKKYFMAQIRVDTIVKYPEVLKKMADAGFIYLFLGLESFSDRTLEKLNKRLKFKQIKSALRILHDLGYFIQGNIIIGATLEDTKQDIESTIEIAKNLDIHLLSYSLLTPFPGTKLMEEVINDDLLLSKDWNDFNWSVPVIKYAHLSSDDLSYYLSKAYKETSSLKKPFRGIRMLFLKRGMKFHISRISPVDIFKLISRMIKNLCKMVSHKQVKKK